MRGQHINSRKSYIESIESGMINNDTDRIIALMLTEPPLTERQIASRLGWDIYKVRRRMSELITKGICVQCGSVKCPVTGKTVRVVRLANENDIKIKEQDERMVNLSAGSLNFTDPLNKITQIGNSPNPPISVSRMSDDELRELITSLRSQVARLENELDNLHDEMREEY